jgi:dihydroflavonol-4-reductase
MLLVTGATGFLGSRIANMLSGEGHKVRCTGHPDDPVGRIPGEYVPCDLLDEKTTQKAVEGVTAVFHVAAMVTFQPSLYDMQMQVNVEGTRILLEAAQKAGVKRFVYTSTVNTLGIPPEGELGDENTPFNWQPWRLGYMDSKHAAEKLVLASDLDVVCALPVTMFGPGDVFFNAGSYIKESARGRAILAPPGGTTVAHVDDVAYGHWLAYEKGKPGERYILGGDPLNYMEILTMIAEELGRRPPIATAPGFLLRWIGRQSDRLRRHLRIPIQLSEGLMVAGSSHLYYSHKKAERELGYTARPAHEAIRDAVDWYREKGMI